MLLKDVIETFIAERTAVRYSRNTIRDYKVTFNKLYQNIGDVHIDTVERNRIIEAFVKLQEEK